MLRFKIDCSSPPPLPIGGGSQAPISQPQTQPTPIPLAPKRGWGECRGSALRSDLPASFTVPYKKIEAKVLLGEETGRSFSTINEKWTKFRNKEAIPKLEDYKTGSQWSFRGIPQTRNNMIGAFCKGEKRYDIEINNMSRTDVKGSNPTVDLTYSFQEFLPPTP